MAKSLDELLRLKGVIAAGEFGANGKLLDFRSKGTSLPDDEALLTDQFAVAVSQLLFALPLSIVGSVASWVCWLPAMVELTA